MSQVDDKVRVVERGRVSEEASTDGPISDQQSTTFRVLNATTIGYIGPLAFLPWKKIGMCLVGEIF